MKLKRTTKLQYNNRHFSTTFPSAIVDAMEGNRGDIIAWEFTTKNDEPILSLKLIKTD